MALPRRLRAPATAAHLVPRILSSITLITSTGAEQVGRSLAHVLFTPTNMAAGYVSEKSRSNRKGDKVTVVQTHSTKSFKHN